MVGLARSCAATRRLWTSAKFGIPTIQMFRCIERMAHFAGGGCGSKDCELNCRPDYLASVTHLNYTGTVMIADIRHHLQAGPFEPFSIVTSSRDRYRIASADHAGLHPSGSRVVIWFHDDSGVTVSGLHIVAIEKETAKNNGSD